MSDKSNDHDNDLSSNDIQWQNRIPFSAKYNDIYFSKNDAIAETEYVFIRHNQLIERFTNLKANEKFTIIETGFGTGLNFLCTWKLFKQYAHTQAKLNFISIEKHPLNKQQLMFYFQQNNLLHEYIEPFIAAYKKDLTKFHYIFDSNIMLSIYFMDISIAIRQIKSKAHAWFLDGFAPAKNPEMWTQDLFDWMATASHEQATLATFTAARIVYDGLKKAGFCIRKQPGFSSKRDMITGVIPKIKQPLPPWFLAPELHACNNNKALIIGAGLAGLSTAYALAERDWQVTILDSSASIATGASGNLQGLAYAKLSAQDTPFNNFLATALDYSLHKLNKLAGKKFHNTGIIQISKNKTEFTKQQAIVDKFSTQLTVCTANDLAKFINLPLLNSGLYFANSGWINVAELCQILASHKNIKVITNSKVRQLKQIANNHWQVLGDNNNWQASTVIISQGHLSSKLSQTKYLPLKAIRGQVTYVAATHKSELLTKCVCADGYITPAAINDKGQKFHTIGATFDLHETTKEILDSCHQQNIKKLKDYFPAMFAALNINKLNIIGGRVGFRCTTPDYLPVVGAIVDSKEFNKSFEQLSYNANSEFTSQVPYLPGLYINSGHGSRGLISCLFCAELLAKMITEKQTKILHPIMQLLNPTRFLVKNLKRRCK